MANKIDKKKSRIDKNGQQIRLNNRIDKTGQGNSKFVNH